VLSLYVVPSFYALLAPFTGSPEALSREIERLERETPEAAGEA
jgi:multidrug efflux pump